MRFETKSGFCRMVCTVFASVVLVIGANGQSAGSEEAIASAKAKPAQTGEKTAADPLMKDFRKVEIGQTSDAVRTAWGKPSVEDKTGFLYEFSDDEMAQVSLDRENRVQVIAVTYRTGKGAPLFADVFGPGVTMTKQENGSVYHLARYPDAGYWVSYYAAPGENGMITVTMSRL